MQHVRGSVLWANLHLLFWLSLLPFVSGFMGENGFAMWPVVLYGVVLPMCAIAYTILVRHLLATHPGDSKLARAIGSDRKGKISLAIYVLGIALSFLNPWLGFAAYVVVAIIWFIPDRRIENRIENRIEDNVKTTSE
ncbi:MAG: hypothetical protein HC853_06210 [Anaerolineae bacterium]|nr:hypothetical protein [Anaerolineae bacterium]